MRANIRAERIHTPPDPYDQIFISQAFRIGDVVITSGQAADLVDEEISPDFRIQADQAFASLSRVLEAAGSCLENVVKVTIFVTDMASNYPTILDLRRQYFVEPYPADSIIEVRALARPGFQIEIEAIALVSGPNGAK